MPVVPDAVTTWLATNAGETKAHTVASANNRYLIFRIACNGDETVTGASYAGVAMSLICKAGQTDSRYEIWGLANPTSGTNNLVTTYSNNNTHNTSIASYYNVNGIGSAFQANGVGVTPTVTVTDAKIGGMVVDAAQSKDQTPSVGAGQTAEYIYADDSRDGGHSREQATATSVEMSWSCAAAGWYIGAVCLYPTLVGSQIIFIMYKQYQDLYWRLRNGLQLPDWYLRRKQPTWVANTKYVRAIA